MSFHLYRINELYSNSDGSIQFIEMSVGDFNAESFWNNQSISVTQGSATNTFSFPADLPNTSTANTSVLIATQGFANLGVATPDFIIPDGFLFTNGSATVNFADVDAVTYNALPLDGTNSIDRDGAIAVNSPKNFAGEAGTIVGEAGTVQSNSMVGTDGADTLTGTDGNDFLNGLGGDDSLDGGAGADTAVYSGNSSAFDITATASGFSVGALPGAIPSSASSRTGRRRGRSVPWRCGRRPVRNRRYRRKRADRRQSRASRRGANRVDGSAG